MRIMLELASIYSAFTVKLYGLSQIMIIIITVGRYFFVTKK